MDSSMGPTGRSSSDYSGARATCYCSGCGCELGQYTPAGWAAETQCFSCRGDPHEYEDPADSADADEYGPPYIMES